MKASKIVVIVLVVLALGVIARNARLVFRGETRKPEASSVFKEQCIQIGIASWYGKGIRGRRTASGEKYDPNALTAAHRKFPFGTQLNIINLENDRNVTVTVNDRGPYLNNRIVDLSAEAAHRLDMKKPGLVAVCVQNATKTDSAAGAGTQ